jgi:putative ABC transport system substrate-binding protein
LVTSGTNASVAANRLAGTTPVVFISVGNPLGMGLVESLARPGRNVTGFSDILADIAGKLVEIACEIASPDIAAIDYFWHTAWPDGYNRFAATEAAAAKARVKLRSRGIVNVAEIDQGVADMKKEGASVLIVQPSPFTFTQRQLLLEAASKYGVGMIFAFPVAAREGALIGYGPDYVQMYRKAPVYIDRILKGVKPADLPVEQPTKIQTIINMKTAKALGIDVPLSLMLRADELLD